MESNAAMELQGLASGPFGLPGVNMGVDMPWFSHIPGVQGLLPGMFAANVMPGLVGGTLVSLPLNINNGNVPQPPHTPEPPPLNENPPANDSPETKPTPPILSLPLPIIPPHN